MTKPNKKVLLIVSILFGLSCLAGDYIDNDIRTMPTLCALTLINIAAFFSTVLIVRAFFEYGDRIHVNSKYMDRSYHFFDRYAWFKVSFILFLFGMFFATAKYPGVVSGGTQFMIQQAMGMDTKARQLSPVIYEGHYVTGHHPVLLTFFLGAFIKIGCRLGHPNWGMYLAACAFTFLNALGWGYVIAYFRNYIKPYIWSAAALWYFFNPMIGSFNSYVIKDNLFATSLAVYCCILHEYMGHREKNSFKKLLICSLILPFVKNQGIYIVIIASLMLIIVSREKIAEKLTCAVVPILVFHVLFEGLLMPMCKIAPGGSQEMFSIFFQSTAGTIVEHPEVKESEEYKIIHKVLPIDDWTVYNPEVSDAIKFKYNQNTTKEEFLEYLIVWLKMATKYPTSYLRAIMHQTYGYYCIDRFTRDWIFPGYDLKISDSGRKISGPVFAGLHKAIGNFLGGCTKKKRFQYFFSVPSAFWIIVVSLLLFKGRITRAVWLSPLLLQWLICLVSPVNAGGRYGFVIYAMVPVILGVINRYNSNVRAASKELITDSDM